MLVVQASPTTRVEAYLGSIPGGLDGHPEAQVKFSVVDGWLDGYDPLQLRGLLPAPVQAYVGHRVPVTRWIPEVHAHVVYLALRDQYFATDADFIAESFSRNRALFQRPIYRVLLRMLSAIRIGQGAALMHAQLHRGTSLDVSPTDDRWTVTLRHPAHLIPELIGHCYGTSFRAVLEMKGATSIEVSTIVSTPTEHTYSIAFESATMS